jgi:hypothetical protein
LSSRTVNSIINWNVMNKISKQELPVTDYMRRLSIHLDIYDDKAVPLVYIAGKPPQQAFNKAKELGLVEKINDLSLQNNVAVYKLIGAEYCGREFCVFEERNHPSAHYYSGEVGRNEFKETIGIINWIARCFSSLQGGGYEMIDESILNEYIATATGLSQQKIMDRHASNLFISKLI